ncbi:MAG: hypothetical protein QHH10_12090 [Peptococcaceae bacterium]|jgi:hypothetical protein|nr:hypothetical protein [Peptococcaceae bacterium]MDH7526044.1 hypothetical protein [Peptococcaceae bacterium]
MSEQKKETALVNGEQIQQWKNQYGEVYKIESEPDGVDDKPLVFYFKKPNRQHFSRFIKDSMKDAFKAMNTMVMDLVLYPSSDKVTELFQEKPGLVVAVGSELTKIVGVSQDFLTTKV